MVVVHAINSSTWKAQAVGSLKLRAAWFSSTLPVLHIETLPLQKGGGQRGGKEEKREAERRRGERDFPVFSFRSFTF